MSKPEHAKRVLYVGMGSITVLYVIFGVMGYLTYGSSIEDSITLNLATRRPGACAYELASLISLEPRPFSRVRGRPGFETNSLMGLECVVWSNGVWEYVD